MRFRPLVSATMSSSSRVNHKPSKLRALLIPPDSPPARNYCHRGAPPPPPNAGARGPCGDSRRPYNGTPGHGPRYTRGPSPVQHQQQFYGSPDSFLGQQQPFHGNAPQPPYNGYSPVYRPGPPYNGHLPRNRPRQMDTYQQCSPITPRLADYRRKWRFASSQPPPNSERFVVLSYNILADYLVRQPDCRLYTHINYEFMDWEWRKNRLLFEFQLWSPDIICLQEVDRFPVLQQELENRGYNGRWKMRTGKAEDGCAIFWRTNRFQFLHQEHIEFNQLGLRDNVAQICVLESRIQRTRENDSSLPASSNKIVVCNIHVLYNPKRGEIKLGQVRSLFERAHEISKNWNDAPVILCGDFNSTPNSPLYKFISEQKLDITGLARNQISGQYSGNSSPRKLNFFNPSFYKSNPTIGNIGEKAGTGQASSTCQNSSSPVGTENSGLTEDGPSSEHSTDLSRNGNNTKANNLSSCIDLDENQEFTPENSKHSSTIDSLDSGNPVKLSEFTDFSIGEDNRITTHEAKQLDLFEGNCVINEEENSDPNFLKELLGTEDECAIQEANSSEVLEDSLNHNAFNADNFRNYRFDPYFWTPDDIKLATGSEERTCVQHNLKLRSVYTEVEDYVGTKGLSGEPEVTSYNRQFMGTVDYMWRSSGLHTVRILDTFPKHILQQTQGFPTKKWGSDHIALACELAFTNGSSTKKD